MNGGGLDGVDSNGVGMVGVSEAGAIWAARLFISFRIFKGSSLVTVIIINQIRSRPIIMAKVTYRMIRWSSFTPKAGLDSIIAESVRSCSLIFKYHRFVF